MKKHLHCQPHEKELTTKSKKRQGLKEDWGVLSQWYWSELLILVIVIGTGHSYWYLL